MFSNIKKKQISTRTLIIKHTNEILNDILKLYYIHICIYNI